MNYDIDEVVFMYFDKFLDLLKLAFRQKAAVYDAVEFFKNFFFLFGWPTAYEAPWPGIRSKL